jgi:CarboxypepD_reg-like domain
MVFFTNKHLYLSPLLKVFTNFRLCWCSSPTNISPLLVFFTNKHLYQKLKWIAIFLLLSTSPLLSQTISQSLHGRIKESISQQPLAQANISVFRASELIKGTVSDSLGYFLIKDVEPGRYKLIVSFTGFVSQESELLVISGKAQPLEVFLTESKQQLDEVVVSSQSVSLSNTTSIPIEKTLRVPANFFDPVRMLTSYPGVVAANDQANSIVVKGHSPNGILWRLQGLDIINPNHLANAGTFSDKPAANGGGVNVLSAQLLDRTDFYSGTLPVQYGNALSGAMDMTLRPGGANKMQYTAQASLIGLDVSAEGPFSKSSKSSFLANYRYSTVGLLSDMGVDFGGEAIRFQDFSFHVNVPGKRGGNLSAFGFGGLSANDFNAKPESEWKEEKDRYTINYSGKVYGVGIVNNFKPGWMNMSAGVSFSGQDQQRKSQSEIVPFPYPYVFKESYDVQRALVSGFVKGTKKIGTGLVEAGLRANYLNNDMDVSTTTQLYIDSYTPNYKGAVSGLLWQPYIAWSQPIGQFNVGAGLRYVHFSYNGTSSIEPRASIARNWNNNLVSLSYSLSSQLQQSFIYVMNQNKNLGFTKSNQFSLEWKKKLSGDLSMVTSAYYHQVFNVPLLGNYSLINQWDEYVRGDYTNDGKGKNYGVEAQVEKRFYGNIYFMATGSVFRSEYFNGTKYLDSRFNGKFTSSFLAGKEWKKTNKSFGIHARAIYTGGLREAYIDLAASEFVGTTMHDYQLGYPVQLPNYFRTDLRISWRKNKPGYTRTLSVDIQNLTNQQNIGYLYYDTFLNAGALQKIVSKKYQVGIIPVLAYRVEF